MSKTGICTLLLAFVATACSTKSASEYETSEMLAHISATSRGNGQVEVNASLNDPQHPLTFLQLTADDQFWASVGNVTKKLGESSVLGAVNYSSSFPGDAEGTAIRVWLERPGEQNASSFTVLPAPFTLIPLAAQGWPRSDTLIIQWNSAPSSDPMSLEITGRCIEAFRLTAPAESTAVVLPPHSLKYNEETSETSGAENCRLTATLSRVREGQVASAFRGGHIRAIQTREFEFDSIP